MSTKRGMLVTVACAAIIGIVTFGCAIWQSDGFFTLVTDFNQQQIPFTAAAWEGVRSGSSWLWGVDLGASLITTFSFYNLGSPFFWLTLLFPKDGFPVLAGWLFILKYMIAAGGGYAYLRRFGRSETAVIGALVYAFSGFQATNLMFNHFHDVVAFFPLLMIGLEEYLEENRKSGLILSVFLNCLVNYFFFIQETVFLVIYFVLRTWQQEDPRQLVRRAGGCVLCGLWGVCMAGILFVPSMLYVLEGDRSRVTLSLSWLFYQPADLLHILKGILLPADTMEGLSAVMQYNFNSTSCYLPLFGIGPALAYVMKKRDWLGKLLMFLAVLSFFPFGSGLFLLFTGLYQRWWYMWTLMMALATVRVLEQPEEYPVKKAALFYGGMTALFTLGLWGAAHLENSGIHIYDGHRIRVLILTAVAGAALQPLLLRGQRRKLLLLGMACAFCAGTTAMTLYPYRDHEWSPQEVKTLYRTGLKLKTPDDQYRFNSTENLLMMTGNTGGIGAFSSTLENGSYRFNQLMSIHFVSNTLGRILPGLPQLLGAKYEISEDEASGTILASVEAEGTTFRITERDACPIGFALDRWVSEEDLLSVPREQRAVVLMNAFVADGQTKERLNLGTVPRMGTEEFAGLDQEECVRRTIQDSVTDFERGGKGFVCRTGWERDRFVYFSVPYDRGWSAEIDGEKTEIFSSGGMIVVPVPAGKHRLEFAYHTPGFLTGAAASAASFAALFLYWIRAGRKGKKRPERT